VPPRVRQPRPAARPPKETLVVQSARASVSPEAVSRRAYEIYEARGPLDGSPLDDWLRAERELMDSADAQAIGRRLRAV
jgi:hypothetical protein